MGRDSLRGRHGRLTDERFAALIGEYRRLGSEQKDLQTLNEELDVAVTEAGPPGRVGSIAEYHHHVSNAEETRKLREEAQNITTRFAEITGRRRCVLHELFEAGMPKGIWVRFGDRAVLLRDAAPPTGAGAGPDAPERPSFGLELREALWEAVLRSPEEAPVREVEQLSGEIRRYNEAGALANASWWIHPFLPAIVASCLVLGFPAGWTLAYLFVPMSAAEAHAGWVGSSVMGVFLLMGSIFLAGDGYAGWLEKEFRRMRRVARPLPQKGEIRTSAGSGAQR